MICHFEPSTSVGHLNQKAIACPRPVDRHQSDAKRPLEYNPRLLSTLLEFHHHASHPVPTGYPCAEPRVGQDDVSVTSDSTCAGTTHLLLQRRNTGGPKRSSMRKNSVNSLA